MTERIWGFSGTSGSGKDYLANYLAAKHRILHVPTGDILRNEARIRGWETDRQTLINIAVELRCSRGPAILIELAQAKYHQEKDSYPGGLLVSGLRAVPDAHSILQTENGVLVYVDADSVKRYEGVVKRGRSDQPPTYEAFMDHENAEFNGVNGENGPHLAMVKALATVAIFNHFDEHFLPDSELALGLS